MSIFSRIFAGRPTVGVHPDVALVTREFGEAQNYIHTSYECPTCRKSGRKNIRGHITVLRRMPNGQRHFYDVYRVLCECGKFSSFWGDSSRWVPLNEAVDALCPPDGKCRWLTGSGQPPDIDRSLFADGFK